MGTKLLKIIFVSAGLIFACPLQAEDLESLSKKLAAQEAQIAELKRMIAEKIEADKAKAEEVKKTELPKVEYSKGYLIKTGTEEKPFDIKINGRMQFRYNGFARKNREYTFDDGKKGEQNNRNDFEIERGRLEFSGHIGDPNLEYYINLDFDTDDNHDVKAHDFWVNYVFSDEFDLYVGKAFVPGSREWLEGSTTTHLSDRSLATSFFRPDRSLGVWATGEVLDGLNYRAMVSNGFSTTDLESEDVDTQFTYAVSTWGDLIGEYGKGRADLEYHQEAAVRVGSSFTYSPITANQDAEPVAEADAVRLSNGTRLDATGALADGVTVSEYDIFLYAVDLGYKYRGFSVNSEAYYRAIENIKADAGLADNNYSDMGVYVDTGYFLLPKTLEAVVRYSLIDGDISDSYEYAGGFNYYINNAHSNKLTFDVTKIDDSPVSNSGPNYRVGDTGVLYRVQWQVAF